MNMFPSATATTNDIIKNVFFSFQRWRRKHRQSNMKHITTISLIPKQTVLISSVTLHSIVNLCRPTTNCNTNNDILCSRLNLITCWSK
jgi:hypothetical protein